ncbi:MAG: exopolyphosphatase, 5',3' nucleotidease [uncultured archaeon A07HB70]|jgi:5''-nucleotidase (EC 3.1.3.5)/3''-nucleotidase (EC 3.1.3.6)/exopolyphosphatase (EC 3.6.1.11)|nr:MAG: exopolyphosphatase, 5',3' nucleotidease [uncultured archaeon A07HB70]
MTEDRRRVLLTNDDGIDSVGFRALYDRLTALDGVEVTAVAPADDQSAVGRRLSTRVEVWEHDLGYAVEGTPADCVVAGVESLCPDTDVVVAGCNKGANLGEYVLGRSGTVSAAVEATFFDVPAIAASLFVPPDPDRDWREAATDPADYADATGAAAYLVDHAFDAGVFDQADYLNINAPPAGGDPAPMTVTFPSETYDMRATRDGERIHLDDMVWGRLHDGSLDEPANSDRGAVMADRVSVSPLTAPHTTEHHEALDALAETYGT